MWGLLESVLANAKPPTPAPAIRTFKGFFSEISSTYFSVSTEDGGLVDATFREERVGENLLLTLGLFVICCVVSNLSSSMISEISIGRYEMKIMRIKKNQKVQLEQLQ